MLCIKRILLFIISTSFVIPSLHIKAEDAEEKVLSNIQRLKTKLMDGYDAETRPVMHHSNTTTVYFNVVPLAIVQVLEDWSLLHVDSWLYLYWDDYRLTWNQSDYEGLDHIPLRDHQVWQPDITIYNGHSGMVDPKVNTPILVYSGGHVVFVPPAVLVTRCPIKPEGLYPKDTLHCQMTFGSWSHDGWQIDLQLDHENMYFDHFENSNPMWELMIGDAKISRIVTYYDCCVEPYVTVVADFPLKRRPPQELQVVWAPCILVMAMTLIMFWIPANSNKKIILGAFLFTALCLLIIYVAVVTRSRTSIKRSVSFLESTLYAVTTAIILEILIINLCNVTGPCRPPEAIVRILSSPMTHYLAIWAPWEKTTSVDKLQLKEDTEQAIHHPTPNEEWILTANGLDRLFFFIFIIILAAIHQI